MSATHRLVRAASALAMIVSAAVRVGAQAVPARAGGAPDWAALCRAELARPAEVERAAVVFARAFPSAGWQSVLIAESPPDAPAVARASVVAARGVDLLSYWRAPVPGAVLLHELTHAWQDGLPDDAFDALLAALAARDRAPGHDAQVVADPRDLIRLEADRIGDRTLPGAPQHRPPTAAEQDRREIADHLVHQPLRHEGTSEGRSAFQQHAAHTALEELGQHVGWFLGAHQRRGGVVEHLRRHARPSLARDLSGIAAASRHTYDWGLNDTRA